MPWSGWGMSSVPDDRSDRYDDKRKGPGALGQERCQPGGPGVMRIKAQDSKKCSGKIHHGRKMPKEIS